MNRVRAALEARGESYKVHRHPPIRNEADLHLTGLDWATSVKTLAFALPDARLALVGVPGSARIQYGAVARALGVSRSALKPAAAEALAAVGMQPGGVSPICADEGVVLLLDAAVPSMGVIYCGGGDPETTIEVDASALSRIASRALVAELTAR